MCPFVLQNARYITIGVVNKIYTDQIIVLKNGFKDILNSCFHSDIEKVDFTNNIEKTVKDINSWCAEHTNNKIKEILTSGTEYFIYSPIIEFCICVENYKLAYNVSDAIDSTTRMILLNAVYFKADWSDKFVAAYTSSEPFHINKSTIVNVPTMHNCTRYYYKDLKHLDAECVALPYQVRYTNTYRKRILFVL